MTSAGKRLASFCVVAVMLMTMFPITADAMSVEWSGTFTGFGNNTVATTILPSDPNTVEQVWSKEAGNNTIVILDGKLYTYHGVNSAMWSDYSDGGIFYEIDAETGEVLNFVECAYGTRFYYSYSIYANGLIYVGCPTAILAFDPTNCALVWESAVTERYYPTIQYINGCIVSNGTVLNAETGEVIKTIAGDCQWGGGWSNGVEIGSYFYVADATESLYAIDTESWTVADVLTTGIEADATCPGVMYYEGRLYWGGISANLYSTALNTDGTFDDTSWKSTASGIKCYGAPVAANDRVYLAGMTTNTLNTNTGTLAICVFDAETTELIYMTDSDVTGKIQSTPILCDTGSVVRIYVQGYKKPGIVYFLEDTSSQTSGSLTALLEPDQTQYAWEQLACDSSGAIYCSNDAGYLMKYQSTVPLVQPEIKGDANGDRAVDLKDATLLSQYLAGWDVEINETTSDTNGDGSITITDIALIRRYLAGWDVSFRE